jgi:hypothetical protein
MASEEGDLRAEKMQDTQLPHLSNKNAKRIEAGNFLSDLFGGQGWGHNIANGNLFRAAIKGIVAAGPCYEIPADDRRCDNPKAPVAQRDVALRLSLGNHYRCLFLMCELMPGHHDNEIAAAEDKSDIREAHIINEAIYVDIIAAGNAQTRPALALNRSAHRRSGSE